MRLYIVVPNWNGADWLGKCLDSLQAQTVELTIIVVENGSTDDSFKVLKKYPNVIVLEQPVNKGFAEGVNIGIKYALDSGAEYILLFNNDAVADRNWAKSLLRTAQSNPEVGIVTCKLMRNDRKRLDSTGDFYTVYGLPFPRGRDELDTGQYDEQLEVFGASGGASLYRSTMFKEIGLFDEDFFAYFGDVDISFRAQLAGWKIRFEPKAIAYHHVSATSSKLGDFSIYQTAKNFPYVFIKNVPSSLLMRYLPRTLYWYGRMGVARIVKGGGKAFIRGFLESMIHMPKKLRERSKIQRNRTVSTAYINSIIYPRRPPVLGESMLPLKIKDAS